MDNLFSSLYSEMFFKGCTTYTLHSHEMLTIQLQVYNINLFQWNCRSENPNICFEITIRQYTISQCLSSILTEDGILHMPKHTIRISWLYSVHVFYKEKWIRVLSRQLDMHNLYGWLECRPRFTKGYD